MRDRNSGPIPRPTDSTRPVPRHAPYLAGTRIAPAAFGAAVFAGALTPGRRAEPPRTTPPTPTALADGTPSIGAVKAIAYAATATAKDAAARITGVRQEIDAVLAILKEAFDGTSAEPAREAMSLLESATTRADEARDHAAAAGETALEWASGL
ncbi:hypothetical protein Afil01_51920 [Actinorhabdospora filicis]|uniref:Uncharacterized protein n=1 Tax=Actinorhabdospora filicis TaxID=1785913 RepID=A0A9W6SR00_9ACTN|nr:hypothetical protein [Actinorhabdospora filicis]GLZ80385.1 hypothetical protein Afil01_51920 [Actinorhabdospora filicis]